MKAILYIGATLMVGASIYGFVGYKNSSRDKKFRNLYESKETLKPREVAKPAESSRTSALLTSEPEIKKLEDHKNASTENKKAAVVKKKRKVSVEKFSRAPLDEKYLKEEKEQTKKEPAKVKEKQL